jgi:hypothetical protein
VAPSPQPGDDKLHFSWNIYSVSVAPSPQPENDKLHFSWNIYSVLVAPSPQPGDDKLHLLEHPTNCMKKFPFHYTCIVTRESSHHAHDGKLHIFGAAMAKQI